MSALCFNGSKRSNGTFKFSIVMLLSFIVVDVHDKILITTANYLRKDNWLSLLVFIFIYLLFRSNLPKTLQLNWLPASQPKLEPIGIVIVGDV